MLSLFLARACVQMKAFLKLAPRLTFFVFTSALLYIFAFEKSTCFSSHGLCLEVRVYNINNYVSCDARLILMISKDFCLYSYIIIIGHIKFLSLFLVDHFQIVLFFKLEISRAIEKKFFIWRRCFKCCIFRYMEKILYGFDAFFIIKCKFIYCIIYPFCIIYNSRAKKAVNLRRSIGHRARRAWLSHPVFSRLIRCMVGALTSSKQDHF